MSVGTLSLIAIPGDIENEHFLNNPDITFFKSVYRRHTNFSKFLSIAESPNSDNFAKTVQYSLDGSIADLLSKVYLQHRIVFDGYMPGVGKTTFFANLGTNIISSEVSALKLDIGPNTIFQNSDLYLETKYELMNEMVSSVQSNTGKTDYFTVAPSLSPTFDISASLVGCTNGSHFNYTTLAGGVRGCVISHEEDATDGALKVSESASFSTENFYCIPDFSFNYDYGLAIPIGILRNTKIDFYVTYKQLSDVIDVTNSTGPKPILKSTCIKEYIHLDVEEKKRFITNSHTYITESYSEIPTAGETPHTSLTGSAGLVKYILMAGQPLDTPYDTTTSASTPTVIKFTDLNLNIDSNPLNQGSLEREVYSRLNLHNYFPGSGRDLSIDAATGGPTKNHGHLDSICVFPICLHPLNYTQPSGCISNINSGVKTLSLNFKDLGTNVKVFIVEYNLLRISDGQCQKMLGT